MTTTTTILQLNSGVNYAGSTTRMLATEVVNTIRTDDTRVIVRDLTEHVPTVYSHFDLGAIHAGGTSEVELAALAEGDALIDELIGADVVVIAAPLYNFTIPASLKLWIDKVARAGRTFAYSEDGPKGLLENKRAIVVIASGGVPLGSPMDYASPYMKFVLGFVGITDVTIIEASRMNFEPEASLALARKGIAALV
jgi:FMN-dependent NADH-azoreductase